MSETSDSFANLSKERLGLSFLDISRGYPKPASRATLSSRGYPDVGLRVVRHGAGAALATAVVPHYKRGWHRPPAPGDFSATANDGMRAGAAPRSANVPSPIAPPAAPAATLAYDPATFSTLEGLVHCGNLGRSGVFKTSGVPALKGLKWKFQTGGPVKSSPVIVNGVCYVGSYDGGIYALDDDTGALKWSNKTVKAVSGSAAVVDNRVSIAGEDGYLNMTSRNIYGYDVSTGTQTWQSTSTGPQGFAALCLDTNRM